jgi:hypothetical protein
VIIDGALPRTNRERCQTVFDYLITLPGVVVTDAIEEIDPSHETGPDGEVHDEDWPHWYELEDAILQMINQMLPDDYVCTLGESQPGDVIVREVGHPDEEMRH